MKTLSMLSSNLPAPEQIGNWQKSPSCTNYIIYTHSILPIGQEQRKSIQIALNTLGELNDYATCNVTILNAQWGFVTIPPLGFTELKVNFYSNISTSIILNILEYINKQIT